MAEGALLKRSWKRNGRAPFGLGRSELLFGAAIIGLAVTLGVIQPRRDIAYSILLVLWSGLIGMMIPQIRAAHRRRRLPPPVEPGTVGHDISSALFAIEGGVEAMRHMRGGDESEGVESIAHAIGAEIRRIRRLSTAMLTSNPSCDPGETIEPIVRLHRANGASIDCVLERCGEVTIAGDDLARVVANLLDNCAVHATGAPITIRGRTSADRLVLVVRDEGPGIPPELLDRATAQGVSTRDGGGLGLYSARSLVETAGGSIEVSSSEGSGTEVTIRLPLTRSEPTGAAGSTLSMSA